MKCLITLLLFALSVAAQVCSERVFKHVYHPLRFDRQACVTVRGRVISTVGERDGDRHIRLQLDGGGKILVEIICVTTPLGPAAKEACGRYRSKLKIPKKGQHISVTGFRVFDLSHSWLEIHPLTRLRILKK